MGLSGSAVSRWIRLWRKFLKVWGLRTPAAKKFGLEWFRVGGVLSPRQLLRSPGPLVERILKRYPEIGDGPKSFYRTPPEASIEPLKRFYRTPFWVPKRFFWTLVRGTSEPQTGFYRTFRIEPPLFRLHFQNSPCGELSSKPPEYLEKVPLWLFPFSENSRRLWLSEIRCWKSFPANFDAAGKFFTDFPAAPNAIPAKVWAFFRQGKRLLENRPRLRERSWTFASETATAFLSFSDNQTPGHSLLLLMYQPPCLSTRLGAPQDAEPGEGFA